MRQAYIRCNSGHYFMSPTCPLDGWGAPYVEALHSIITALPEGADITIEMLRQQGATEDAIRRTIIIEFGNPASAFEAMTPGGYVINGEYKKMIEVGNDFL